MDSCLNPTSAFTLCVSLCLCHLLCLCVCVCFSVCLPQQVCSLPLLAVPSLAAASLPAHECPALQETVLVDLPSTGLPPARTRFLGLNFLAHRRCRTDLLFQLVGVAQQVVEADPYFSLLNKLKQTVIDHFAYEVKHGSMN